MDIALRIFAEKGFGSATISEISNAAGFSEATIDENFGTKEDLLFAIPEKISTENLQETERSLDLLQLTTSNKRFRQTSAHTAIRRSAYRLPDCIKERSRTDFYIGELLQAKERDWKRTCWEASGRLLRRKKTYQ